MPALSAIGLALGASVEAAFAVGSAVAGLSLSAASAGSQYYQQSKAADAQREQEKLREKQMNLEADRQRREIIRRTQISQATGINLLGGSGASVDGATSALSGIIGQNTGNQGYSLNAVEQNTDIGTALFASNATESQANSTASLFANIGNFGNTLADNNSQIGRLGATLFGGNSQSQGIGSWETIVSKS